MQGHHLKYNAAGNLMFFFPGYTNEISLPNPEIHWYNCLELTSPLSSQEEARMSNVSSRARNEAASSSQQPRPHHSSVVMQPTYHTRWSQARQVPGFHPRVQPRLGSTPATNEAGGLGWQSVDNTEWAHDT